MKVCILLFFMPLFIMQVMQASAKLVTLEYQVCDDAGFAIPKAQVVTSTEKHEVFLSWTKTIPRVEHKKVTDLNGSAKCWFNCKSGDFRVKVKAEGYYDWESGNMTLITPEGVMDEYKKLSIVLIPKKNPIPLYTAWGDLRSRRLDQSKQSYGFDLMTCDWIAPNGKGEQADFYITHQVSVTNGVQIFESTITFDEGCGAYVVRKPKNAERAIVYAADTNATYLTEFKEVHLKDSEGRNISKSLVLDEDSCLIIRSRVKTDAYGKIVSANYSKIYGQASFANYFWYRQSCFNPVANDTNLEFDQFKNLNRKQGGIFQP